MLQKSLFGLLFCNYLTEIWWYQSSGITFAPSNTVTLSYCVPSLSRSGQHSLQRQVVRWLARPHIFIGVWFSPNMKTCRSGLFNIVNIGVIVLINNVENIFNNDIICKSLYFNVHIVCNYACIIWTVWYTNRIYFSVFFSHWSIYIYN